LSPFTQFGPASFAKVPQESKLGQPRTILTEVAPSLRFLQGWAAMLHVLFDFVVNMWSKRTRHRHFRPPAGGAPLMIFACTIPTEGAPSLRFLQGWAAMLRVLFDFVVDARSGDILSSDISYTDSSEILNAPSSAALL